MKNILVKTLFIAFAFCAVLGLSTAATSSEEGGKKWIKGEGPVVERTVDLGEFSGLSLLGSSDIYLTQGTKREVRLSGQENILDNLDLKNESSILTIKNKLNVQRCEPVKIFITLPTVDLIKITGSGDVKMENHFSNLNDLNIKISGSGNIDADLDGEKIIAEITGSGNISLVGKADATDLSIQGSGNIKAADFKVRASEVHVAGSGSVKVYTTEILRGRISGSGDIGYRGDPSVDSHVSGSGDLHKIRN